jgi:hypothetical protein
MPNRTKALFLGRIEMRPIFKIVMILSIVKAAQMILGLYHPPF